MTEPVSTQEEDLVKSEELVRVLCGSIARSHGVEEGTNAAIHDFTATFIWLSEHVDRARLHKLLEAFADLTRPTEPIELTDFDCVGLPQ
jgi:hypothetical protein